MSQFFIYALGFAGVLSVAMPEAAGATALPVVPEIVINVDEQELKVVKEGQEIAKFPISTSKFGLGDDFRSYKTPVGVFKVCAKAGENLPVGAVLKGGRFTGEVLEPDAPGRDPIVTRMIRLQGLESQNKHTLARGIFIHGTPEEKRIGKPVSWGCIRMRSKDVVALYKQVRVGTRVVISGKGYQSPLEQFEAWMSRLLG
ncbi:MAG: L,D-transpeptidase [Verrucomicrobiota bacterium]